MLLQIIKQLWGILLKEQIGFFLPTDIQISGLGD